MRNLARVLAVDVAAPLAVIGGLLTIGVMLGWPIWWVSVCSMLCLLVIEAVIVNVVLYRRDSVTVGTDDDAPLLRLAVVGVATASVVAAAVVGYLRWTVPDRDFTRDSAEVVRIASAVTESAASFNPSTPQFDLDRAASMMVPERADAFKAEFGKSTADLVKRKASAKAETISAGIEALGPSAGSVAVLLRATQTEPGQPPSSAVLALRVALVKHDDGWKVIDLVPITPTR